MLVVEVNDLKLVNNPEVDGFLIGTEFLSSECYKKFTKKEVIEFTRRAHDLNKKVFLDATQIFHDQDLKKVNMILNELNDVDYVLYNDLALINMIDKEKRFYYSITYVTNVYDYDIVADENQHVLVSPNLKYDELKKFKDKKESFLIAFGTFEIFHSRRPLISNYLKYRNLDVDNAKYQVIEEFRNEKYPIVEEEGTKIYLNDYYYLSEELVDLNHNLIIKLFDLPQEKCLQIISLYRKALNDLNFQFDDEMKKLSLNLHKGLLYQNSILIKEGKNNA